MKNLPVIKICVTAAFLIIGAIGFADSDKSEMQTVRAVKTPEKIVDATAEISGYKNWTRVNKTPELVESRLAIQCSFPTQAQINEERKNPHNGTYINVYVNDIGKDAMLTRKFPQFPVGTVIVKEKLTSAASEEPELLTVMIKRAKNYNAKVGDWEFLTFNGSGTETTARGKLENCQACHLAEKATDYISRRYLPYEIKQKLK